MAIKDILHEAESKMKKSLEIADRELSGVRTGRASIHLVDGIKVDYYGTQVVLKQLAGLSAPEPRLIVIQPWDQAACGEIERAILKSDLGITPTNDGKVIRITLPQLTEERRKELGKVVKRITEECKISVRSVRHHANEKIKELKDGKQISDDDVFKSEGDIQKLTDKYIKEVDKSLSDKEKEIAGG